MGEILFNNFKKIPLRTNSKLPAINNWNKPDVFNAISDSVDMSKNYGVITGEYSDNIVVDLDIHKLNDEDRNSYTLENLKKQFGENCLIVQTPSGGFHIYYQFEDRVKDWSGTCGIEGFIDIRTTGNQVVGPGSKINGKEYEIVHTCEELKPMPESIFNFLTDKMKPPKKPTKSIDDRQEIQKMLEDIGFTNIRWLNSYDFDCDQKGRNATCPLCASSHKSNNFHVSKTSNNAIIVKNHSERCNYRCLYSPIDMDEDDKQLLDEGFEEDYLIMKKKFEKQFGSCFLEDNNCYAILNSEKKYTTLNIKQLKERFLDWKYTSLEKGQKKSFIDCWVQDRFKKRYKKIDFDPLSKSKDILNIFECYDVENIESDGTGTIEPFIELANQLTDNDTDYFFKWLALIFQRPDLKPITSPVFSGVQGTGKNSMFDFLGKMIGEDYYYETNDPDNHIFGRFSTGVENKKLVLLDEMEGNTGFHHSSKIKGYITNKRHTVERKGIQSYSVKNLAGFAFCSNYENPVKIEDSDRRFFCYNPQKNLTQDFWNNWIKWSNNSQNQRCVYDFLMKINIEKVDWIADRPKSKLYKDMKYNSLPSFVKWLDFMITEQYPFRKNAEIEIEDLYSEYRTFGHTREMNKITFGRTLQDYIKNRGLTGFTHTRKTNGVIYQIKREEVYDWLKKNEYTRTKLDQFKENICYIINDKDY